jgi:hypothetical protein
MMKTFVDRFFHVERKDEKANNVADAINKLEIKIDDLSEKIEKVVESSSTFLNPNRRFYLEKGHSSYEHITYIAIRDRHHPSYQSNRNDVTFEDKDVVFYAKSEFTGNIGFISYYTPPENISKALEVEKHLDALEGLGVLSKLILTK